MFVVYSPFILAACIWCIFRFLFIFWFSATLNQVSLFLNSFPLGSSVS